MNKTLRKKLIECWKKDYTDQEAAIKCGIKLSELRLLLKNDEKLSEDRIKAMSYLRMKTKDNIAFDIERGKKTEWYAEKKMGDEYSSKQSISVEGSIDIPVKEKEEQMAEMFKRYE